LKDALKNALKIGTFWGIPLKVHWTFGLLMLFVTYTAFTNNLKMWQSIGFMAIIVVLFICVILHEYGHALTARRMGVNTQDIILSPVGGVARLTNMPENPKQEFLIALAGPAVNLVIGGIIALGLYLYDGVIMPTVTDFRFNEPIELLRYIVMINISLFCFNLIPAFPMDGGRVLRALLSVKMGHFRATKLATFIGRVLAIGFVIFGIFDQQLILAMIGIVIFMMAGQEYAQTKINHLFKTSPIYKVMRITYSKIHQNDEYQTVIDLYYKGVEKNFIVYDSLGNMVGVVPELFIKDVIKNDQPSKLIGEMMSTKLEIVQHNTLLKDLFDTMKRRGLAIVAIEDHGQIVGVLDRHDIESFIDVKTS
jgi:Zn-dependent protease/predicted transcriptional regulator